MQYVEGLKRMIDKQFEQGKREKEQQEQEIAGLFGTDRLEIHLFGKVQGVGFREFVRKTASELGVRGFVRNADNFVEIVAEGAKKDLEKLLEPCLKGPVHARVEKHTAKWKNGTGEFSTFQIQH